MIDFAILALSLTGFILLLLAMTRHQQDWLQRKLPARRSKTLRAGGFAALALAFISAEIGLGWGYGAVAWCGWLTVAAALVVIANINRTRILRLVRSDKA